MASPDEWQHYHIHRQAIGTPQTPRGMGKPLVWSHVWQVRRPCNHPDMQGDNWEKLGYKNFGNHDDAIRWASAEAAKDRMRQWIEEFIGNDGILSEITRLVMGHALI